MPDVVAALGVVQTTVDVIDKLVGLKDKLRKNPHAAAAALAAALAEVHRTYLAIDDEVTRLLALGFDPEAFTGWHQLLIELDGGAIRARVNQSRGHCSRIRNIYSLHLEKWFESVFNKAEMLMVGEVFDTLQNDDQQVYVLLEAVADLLQNESRAAIDLLMADPPDEAGARARLRGAYRQLRPLRDKLAGAASRLGSLEAEFVEISGAV